MTAPIIPAGAANLADLLAIWRTVINAKVGGGVKVKTTDTSRSNNAAYSDDPHLVIPVLANTVYSVDMYGVYQAGATGLFKVQFALPSGATMAGGSWHYDPGADEWAATAIQESTTPYAMVAGLAGTTNFPFRLQASLHVGANAGNLAFQWAQNVSNATPTIVRKGSWLRALATT